MTPGNLAPLEVIQTWKVVNETLSGSNQSHSSLGKQRQHTDPRQFGPNQVIPAWKTLTAYKYGSPWLFGSNSSQSNSKSSNS